MKREIGSGEKGRRIKVKGGEHWLRDPDSQEFTQNTFLSKDSQL